MGLSEQPFQVLDRTFFCRIYSEGLAPIPSDLSPAASTVGQPKLTGHCKSTGDQPASYRQGSDVGSVRDEVGAGTLRKVEPCMVLQFVPIREPFLVLGRILSRGFCLELSIYGSSQNHFIFEGFILEPPMNGSTKNPLIYEGFSLEPSMNGSTSLISL